MKRNVLIKAVFGNYDEFLDPRIVEPDTDYILFTDQDVTSNVYEVRKMPRTDKIERLIKIEPWEYVGYGYDVYIWIDGNIHPRKPIDLKPLEQFDIICLAHQGWDTLKDEAAAIIRLGKDDPATVSEQAASYYDAGYKDGKFRHVQTGVLIRKGTGQNMNHADLWAHEVLVHSRRDQMSFNYARWQMFQISAETAIAEPTVYRIPWDKFKEDYKYIPHR